MTERQKVVAYLNMLARTASNGLAAGAYRHAAEGIAGGVHMDPDSAQSRGWLAGQQSAARLRGQGKTSL